MSIILAKENISDEKEMRANLAEVMMEMAEKDSRVIYMDSDLMNSIGMSNYAKKFPKQTYNCGIQEANMIGVAAGLSATGFIPFVHTFGVFASRRVMDQVFVSGAYAKQNIKIFGSDPGVTAAFNGGTHMPFEDIGMMRCVPEVTILEPVDSAMLVDLMKQTKDLKGVYYIRLSRKKSIKIYEEGSKFEIGKGVVLKEGKDITICATGILVSEALDAARELEKENISAKVVNIFTIKPIDKELIEKCAKDTGAIVTCENHNIINGLASAVAEVLALSHPVPMEMIGVHDQFGEVGSVDYLKERFNLTAKDIIAAAKKAISRK